MVKKVLGSAKRFGTRYGKTLKDKVSKIEKEVKRKHKCPHCNYNKLRRVAAGIWFCEKCGVKFTAKAYTPKIRKIFIRTGEEEELVDKNMLMREEELEPKKEEEEKEDSEEQE